ncbi:MAG: TRAP transporter small permease [Deltaproteobacteria bacterium]|nr:TRAP transporter small permease [Deltaproteobacteria bacterium]
MEKIKKIWNGFDFILSLLAVIGMVLLFMMMLAVCWEVFTRYFLGRGTIWVIELSEYTMLYMTFLGTAWLLKNEGHVEMDIIMAFLNPRTQRFLKVTTSIISGLLCLLLTWSGIEVAVDHLQRGLHQPTLVAPPDFPIFIVIPIGFFLLFVQFMRRAHGFLIVKEPKKEKERVLA